MDRTLARLLAALWLVAAALVLAPASAPAASTGTLEGALTNATTGKPIPNAPVRLYWAKGQEPQPEKQRRTDVSGRYRFTGLPLGAEYAYVTYAVHQGVEYTSDRVNLTAKQPAQDVTLEVYEATPLDSAVKVKAGSVIVLDVNKESQSMFMLETFVFQNDTKTTFRPVVDGPRGPMGLLRFSLPPNASQLSAMGELASREVIQTDRGFGTNLPIRPGRTEVSFTYHVPYRDPAGVLEFDLTLPYPTEDFRLLVPRNGPRITSPQLRSDKPVQLFRSPGDAYDVMTGANLPARTRIGVAASGLPVNVHFLRPDNPLLWAISGGLLALLIGIALLLWRRAVGAAGAPQARASDESAGLIAALAALDEQYERGALEERAYRRERELRRQRLLALMATAPDAG